MLRLSHWPGNVGLKDATGDLARAGQLLRRLPATFAVYSGNDDSALALMLLGGHGVFSVTANVAPRLLRQLCDAGLSSDLPKAGVLMARRMPLHAHLFIAPNPIPVEGALQ